MQQPRPPVIVGGGGAKRTPRLAAIYADEFNSAFTGIDGTSIQFERVRKACEDAGRDPTTLTLSAAQVVCCGSEPRAIAARAFAIGRDVDELRANGLCGTPDEVVEKARSYASAGAGRLYFQILDLADLDHIALLAAEVLPHL